MTLCQLSLCSHAAIIVYRLPWTWKCSKLMMKFIHAGLNLLAFIFAVISLVAVFDFHNAAKIPNMYSLHSWLGLVAVILYCLQVNKVFDLVFKIFVELSDCFNTIHIEKDTFSHVILRFFFQQRKKQ